MKGFRHICEYLLLTFLIVSLSGCGTDTAPRRVEKDEPQFRKVSERKSQVTFVNKLEEDSRRNIIRYQGYYDGGGVAAADFNNDGLTDLFFTGNMVQNRLYLNQGNLTFKDITLAAGLKEEGFGWYTGVTLIDINNDGFMDMYVCKSGLFQPENRKNLLYINNGDLTFTNRSAEYGLDHSGYSTQASFFDFDKDGDLDMYLANYGPTDISQTREEEYSLRNQRDEYSGDRLFENVDGAFKDVTVLAGIRDTPLGFTHSAGIGDFNQDGWPDIFVCNDFTEHDFYYVNQGDGTFSESMKRSFKHLSNFSMGNDVADFNNDGLLDIVVVDMVAEDNKRLKENMGGMQREDFNYFLEKGFHYQYMFNMLHMNSGNSTFSEIAHLAGISNTDWSWAPLFADFDNDGWKDLYVTNGLRRDARNQDARYVFVDLLKQAEKEGRSDLTEKEWEQALDAMPSQKLKNYMFVNATGLTFEHVSDSWGLDDATFSNGAAYCDLDNDGDLDLVVNNINDPALIYENLAEDSRSLSFILKGPSANIHGIGTEICVWHGGNKQIQQQHFNHGFRSAMAIPIHFGIGKDSKVDSILIRWPDGKSEVLREVNSGQTMTLDYQNAIHIDRVEEKSGNVFVQSSLKLNPDFEHKENSFDDFEREVLLPHTMSALGPFLSVADGDGDGLEDLYIGGAAGYPGRLYLQQASGSFVISSQSAFQADRLYEDMESLFVDSDGDGDLDLYVVSGGNEEPQGSSYYQDRLYLNDGKGNFSRASGHVPKISVSGSVVVENDFDEDGDPDLFVGGRQTPGKYPYPSSSLMLENVDGQFEDASAKWSPDLVDLGMVTSAVWMDYDKDGDRDLIVAGEWMPITIFEKENGSLRKKEVGLDHTTGWWFSLTVEDLDNDGDQDLIAGNVGLNYKYKASEENPFEIYSSDFDGNGSNDIVLAYYQDSTLFPLRGKSCSTEQMPSLKKKFATYSSFAVADLGDVYGEQNLEQALRYQAKEFASVVVENVGDGTFKVHLFPEYAQLSSVNGIVASDINDDGLKDLVVAGNMYGSEIETVRNDAGFGMYLVNQGDLNFVAVPYQESGLYLDGDIKSLKQIDTNRGMFLVAGTNQDSLKVVKVNR